MFTRLYRNLTAACFCWVGWFELYGMMESESGFPMDGGFDICQHFVDGYVQVVNRVIMFRFLGELQVWMDGVKVVKYCMYVSV